MRYARLIDIAVPRVTDPLFDEAERSETSRVAVSGYPAVMAPRNIRKGGSIIDFHAQNMSDRYVPLLRLLGPVPECSENDN